MHLSKNFTLRELCRSGTATRRGIRNVPDSEVTEALRTLCVEVLQPIREHFARAVTVNSGFRSRALNKAVGGAYSSQHTHGEAADVEIAGVDNVELAHWIADNLDVDQVIAECFDDGDPSSGWIHVSYRSKTANRNEALTYRKPTAGGYSDGLPAR